jgi:hypothetical protein
MTTAAAFHRTPIAVPRATSRLARALPLLVACMPKLGCPLCWPALAALCSLFGLPFAALNPALIGIAVAAIAILLISACVRQTFRWPSGLLLAGLVATLGTRLWTSPPWVGYAAAASVLTAVVAQFLLSGHFATIAPSPHCPRNGHTVVVAPRSQE